jgi:hypothetical protein
MIDWGSFFLGFIVACALSISVSCMVVAWLLHTYPPEF